MAKKSGGSARRVSGSDRVAPAMAPEMDELRAELARALTSSVEQTVGAVCARFDEAMGDYARRVHTGLAIDPLADYDMYHGCCVRLVRYIEANMETSPEFAQQMERIILACHSNAAEHVLRSVVTKDLWFHRRRETGEPAGPLKHEKAATAASHTDRKQPPPPPPPPVTRSAEKRGVATRSADRTGVATRSTEKAGVATRSADKARVTTRSAEKRGAGTRTRSGSREPSPAPKRPRRAAARVVLHTESSEEEQEDGEDAEQNEVVSMDNDEEEGGEGEEEEEEEQAKPRRGRRGRSSQPHYEQADELLLNFKDAVSELCYADRRTPEQTKFFKDRLRRSIEFVDAQLCKPPPGQFCSRECKKLRAVMCNGDKPCKNKTCRIWHDVEVHTDCCENPQCEFKNRIMLRETMHKIEHTKQDLQRNRTELQVKRKHLAGTKRGNLNDREKLIETTLLENEITQLEHDIEVADEDLSRLAATRKAFWGILNEIGVKLSDDVTDQFPDFETHYTSRRPPRKSKTPQKSKRSVSPVSTPPARKSERPIRRRGAGPHDESGPAVSTRSTRATRRNTRATQDTDAQMIDVEEEETKEGHSDDDQDTVYEPEHDTHEDGGEGLTEVAPAVGFTLRTNPPPNDAPVEKHAAQQDAEDVQEAAAVSQDVAQNADPEPVQGGAAVEGEHEDHEETEVERHEETDVEQHQEVINARHDQVVVEHRDEVVSERHDEETSEHQAETMHEVREEASLDNHEDQVEDEEENAFSAMNARWPGGL